jgi:predicted transcriptional regulator
MFANFWSRLGRYRKLSALSLGDLEKAVMERMWDGGECAVRDLYAEYNGKLAYTTLMTTVDRLHKKGLLERRKDGKAFIYKPILSREDLDRSIARDLIGVLLQERSSTPFPMLASFVDAINEQDQELLSALEQEIKKRRAASKGIKA